LIEAVPNGIRFPIVAAGRRSGKTERFKRFLARAALSARNSRFFAAAPTNQQAVKIFWDDMLLLSFSSLFKKPDKTNRIIYVGDGNEIHVVGLDKPARFEGGPWAGGGIDEIADVKESSIEENIMPALDTIDPRFPNYRAWCWFFGVPDGLNHFYDLFLLAESGHKDYAPFHWVSADILPKDIIESREQTMSSKQFDQEYRATFEAASGKIYSDYGKGNYTDAVVEKHEAIDWAHDQNFTPLSSAISVIRDDNLYICDEIVLTSAIAEQSAIEFCEKYKEHDNKTVRIFGDPYGKIGEIHGHVSDYDNIEKVLRQNGWSSTRHIKSSHPGIKDRQNAVRAMICSSSGKRRLFVNHAKAPWSSKGLATVQYKGGSTFQEDEKNKYHHITTAIGYHIDYLWPRARHAMSSNFSFPT
jgi:hypothetical protein